MKEESKPELTLDPPKVLYVGVCIYKIEYPGKNEKMGDLRRAIYHFEDSEEARKWLENGWNGPGEQRKLYRVLQPRYQPMQLIDPIPSSLRESIEDPIQGE